MIRNLSFTRLYLVVNNWLFTNNRQVIRILVLFGVLVGSVIIAPRAAMGSRMFGLLIILLAGLGPTIFLLYRPMVGLVLLIPVSLYVPFSIGTGTGTSLNAPILLILLLSGLWVLDMLVRQKNISLISSRPFLPLVLLLAVSLLAFGVGQLPWFLYARQASIAAQIGGLSVFFLSAAIFFLTAHQIQDIKWLRYLTWIFLAFGSVYIIGRHFPSLRLDRLVYGANGSLFWTWMVALAFSQAVFNKTLKPQWRFGLALLAVATIAVGWFYVRDWISGWIPGLVVVGVLTWLRSWRMGLLVSVAAVIMVLVFDPGLLTQLVSADDYSISTREEAWLIVLGDIVRLNPLIGFGPANYYYYTHLFPILGWAVDFSSHNQYIDLLAQTGIAGLLCYFWFAWEIGKLGWRLRMQVPEGFANAYVNGALAGLVGMLVAGMLGDWILPFVYNIGIAGFRASMLGWLFLGALVALDQMYGKTEDLSST